MSKKVEIHTPKINHQKSLEKNSSHSSTPKPKTLKKNVKKAPTVAIIKCDIGFGNTLFIRGEGIPLLNWEKGQALTFDEQEQGWCFRSILPKPVEFKVLINDLQWSEGENLTLTPGKRQIFEPKFLY